jgi:hypothetical protein
MIKNAALVCFPFPERMIKTVAKTTESRKKNKNPGSERRRWPRLRPSSVPFLRGVTLSQEIQVTAIDISRGGMLLETEVRLTPQMKIHLKLVTSDGVLNLEGSVLRSSISSLAGVPKYQSAVVFEHPFHMLDDLSAETAADRPESEAASGKSPGGNQLASKSGRSEFSGSSAVLTFVAPDTPGSYLLEMLELNDW